MRFVLLTNIVSPHQLPLARALAARLGDENFRYVATEGAHGERTKLGWRLGALPSWILFPDGSADEAEEARCWCREADILLSGLRDFALFQQRAEGGLINLYMSERWLKPPIGVLRMLHPRHLKLSRSFRRLLRQGAVTYLPAGIPAAEDLVRISALLSGKLLCLFRKPEVVMTAQVPLAPFAGPDPSRHGHARDIAHMRLWGYFVDPAMPGPQAPIRRGAPLRVLWAGRLLNWKRVDTVVKAVVRLMHEGVAIRLLVVGYGPEEKKLRGLAGPFLLRSTVPESECGASGIQFQEPLPIQEVRMRMREADVVVLSSGGGEGWGAVVNEAMAEGCCVIGTHEAGSSATMIEHRVNGLLYHAGRVEELADLLRELTPESCARLGDKARETLEGAWSPEHAAELLLAYIKDLNHGEHGGPRRLMQRAGSAWSP